MPDLIDGRYELLEVIASGGMATVWRARDDRLDRLVALKRPHPAAPDDDLHARFEREARSSAALSHPNLVTVMDVGRDGDGPFMVMELVDGQTLAEVPRLGPAEAVEIGALLADALATVHAAGIVHRDVKPANVLLAGAGPKLTDFGIAFDPAATQRITRSGAVPATPMYASPEQLAGRAVTGRSDVFSLACVIYEQLAGRPPFGGAGREEPPPALLDRHLDGVLAAALALDPEARPDAADFASSLRHASPTAVSRAPGGDTKILESRPDPLAPSHPHRTRRRLLPVAAVIVAVSLITLLAVQGDETAEPVASSSPPTTGASDTTPPETSAPATTPPTTVEVATGPDTVGVQQARDRFGDGLAGIHPSELNPPERRDLVSLVEGAIAAAADGDADGAVRRLTDARSRLEEKVQGDDLTEAMDALDRLAEALGLEPVS